MSTRVTISTGCALLGVILFVVASVVSDGSYAIVSLFAGLALILLSHILTPCRDQMTKWWSSRVSK